MSYQEAGKALLDKYGGQAQKPTGTRRKSGAGGGQNNAQWQETGKMLLEKYSPEKRQERGQKISDWADRYNRVMQGVYDFNEKRGNHYTQDAGGGFSGEITSLIQDYDEIGEYARGFGLTDGERYVKNLRELGQWIDSENTRNHALKAALDNGGKGPRFGTEPPGLMLKIPNSETPELEQLVSPAFFDKMLGNETEKWNQETPELEQLISPEFLYQMLERTTNNRNQKERELREYNQNFYTPVDLSGRRLTYQEMRNGGSGWETPGSRYYLENQTLGSLAGDEGKAYIQGLQGKKQARDVARQEADRAAESVSLYEDYLKQFGSRDAYRIYLRDLQANKPGAALIEADFENAEAEEKTAQAEYERFLNDEPLGTRWWTSRGVPEDQAEYMVQQEYLKTRKQDYMSKGFPQSYAEEFAKQDYEKAKKKYDEGVRERYKAKEDAESYAEGRRNLKHNRELLEADKKEIDSMTESEKEAFLNYVRMRDRDGESLVPYMNAPLYNRYVEQFSGKYDIARLEELRESYHRLVNAEITQAVAQKSAEWGHAGGATEGAAYVGTFPAKLVGSVSGTVDSVKGLVFGTGRYKGVDPNGLGNLPNVYADNVRGAIGQDIRGGRQQCA